MVATRHSLPSAAAAAAAANDDRLRQPSTDLDAADDKKVKLALRKLQIDGTAALSGGRVKKAPRRVYHWRGAAYEVTDTTDSTWIANQPKRWRKAHGYAVDDDDDDDDDEYDDEDEDNDSNEDHEDVDDDHDRHDTIARNMPRGKKRRIGEVEVEVDNATAAPERQVYESRNKRKRGHEDDEDEDVEEANEDVAPRKRAKRSVPSRFYGRAKRPYTKRKTPHQRHKSPPKPDGRAFDYANVGEAETLSCMEAARARAISRGYAMEPIPMATFANSQPLGFTLLNNIVDMVPLTKKLNALARAFEQNRADLRVALTRRSVMARGREGASNEDDGDTWRAGRDESAGAGAVMPASPPPHRLPSIPTLDSAPVFPTTDIASEPFETTHSRHDSASAPSAEVPGADVPNLYVPSAKSQTPPSTATTTPTNASALASILTTDPSSLPSESYKPAPPTSAHPDANSGGQTIRWSLPDDLASKSVSSHGPSIYFHRLHGETHGQRRRRIKRELKVVQKWDEGAEDKKHVKRGLDASERAGGWES